MTLQEYIESARKAIQDGRLDEAEQFTKQAQALKAVEALTPPADATKTAAGHPVRLPFATEATDEPHGEPSAAVKMWYTKRYGDIDSSLKAVAGDLYGGSDYRQLAFEKNQDFRGFLRRGSSAKGLDRMVLITPTQMIDAIAGDTDVATIKATMLEAQDLLGGYIVPEDWRSAIIQRLPGLTVVRSLANVISTSSDRVTFPKATGGDNRYVGNTRTFWTDEAPTGTQQTNSTWGTIAIPVHTVLSKTPLTRNLVEDAAFDIAGYLQGQFTMAMAIDEDQQFLVGSGQGKPQGIMPNAAPSDADVLAQVLASGNASALTNATLVKLPYQLAAQYRQSQSCRWVFNKSVAATIRTLVDGQGRFLWSSYNDNLQTANGNGSGLLGFTVQESEALPNIAANVYPILFGDFSGYTIADRIGMSIERYQDSGTVETNSIVYYARRRLGGEVTEGWKFAPMKIST